MRNSLVWLLLFLFFFVLPLGILVKGHLDFQTSRYEDSLQTLIRSFTRELTSFRNHTSNDRVLSDIFRTFKESFSGGKGRPDRQKRAIESLLKELPPGSRLCLWDFRPETLVASGSFFGTGSELLGRFLLDGYSQFAEGVSLSGAGSGTDFLSTNASAVELIYRSLGRDFPCVKVVISPGKLMRGTAGARRAWFFWDFLFNPASSRAGFAVFIPQGAMDAAFGFSYLVPQLPSSSPEFCMGYATFLPEMKLESTYPSLEPIARKMMNEYRSNPVSPVRDGDRWLIVVPAIEGEDSRLFAVFSSRRLREETARKVNVGLAIGGVFLIAGLIFFFRSFRRSLVEGLSLRVKISGLVCLSLFLPMALLIFFGIHFFLDREKVLRDGANQLLQRELHRLDDAAKEFFIEKALWLGSLKSDPAIQAGDPGGIAARFQGLFRDGKIERAYLVDGEGRIVYDHDPLIGEPAARALISELGRTIVKAESITEGLGNPDRTFSETLGSEFLNYLSERKGHVETISWPGLDRRVSVFCDVVSPSPQGLASGAIDQGGSPLALILTLNRGSLDLEFLKKTLVTTVTSQEPISFLAFRAEDLSEPLPKISQSLKSNLIPLVEMAQVQEKPDPELVFDDERPVLAMLVKGRNLEGYYLGAVVDWNGLLKYVRGLYGFVFGSLVLSFLGSGIFVFSLIRGVLTPITVLSEGARAIASGDLTRTLPVESGDELGQLSTNFNDMTRRLKNRLTELTVLFHLTQKASLSNNPREIFESAGESLMGALGAAGFGIGWLSEGESLDHLYLVEPRETGDSATIRDVLVDSLKRREMVFHANEGSHNGIMAIPLLFEETRFGGIYLEFSGDAAQRIARSGLSADEKSFVETVRRQLSMIIEKQRLFEQAITDGLTRLYVRRFFIATLEKELARSRRYRSELSLLLLDIDDFKKFNDSYGHQFGDLVLKETAQRIIENIRAVDTPGRYGGEELAVLLPQTPREDAILVAERIRRSIEGSVYRLSGPSLGVTVSIGVATLLGRTLSMESFIEEADKALYQSKAEGKNRVAFFQTTPPRQSVP